MQIHNPENEVLQHTDASSQWQMDEALYEVTLEGLYHIIRNKTNRRLATHDPRFIILCRHTDSLTKTFNNNNNNNNSSIWENQNSDFKQWYISLT